MPEATRQQYRTMLMDAASSLSEQDFLLYVKFRPIVCNIQRDENSLRFAANDPFMIEYNTNGKTVKSRLGRYIRRQYKNDVSNITDDELDKFVNHVINNGPAASQNDEHFTILKGNDIVDAYTDCVGSSSCMTGGHPGVDMYGENDNVNLLVYKTSKYEARALLWQCDDGTMFLDRIYPCSGVHIGIIKEYARKKDWKTWLTKEPHKNYSVTLVSSSGRWPYMDTFIYAVGDNSESTLYIETPKDRHGNIMNYVILDSTEGHYPGQEVDYNYCASCNDGYDVDSDSLVWLDNYDEYICEHCLEQSYTYSDLESIYILDTDCVDCYHNNDIETVSRDYVFNHSLSQCVKCGVYSEVEVENNSNNNNDWVCHECI